MEGRYSRQILFQGIGEEGQRRLGASSALLIGCGALGSLTAELLVRAGVGRLRIADRDFVEPSNLQRQVLFDEQDAMSALPKAAAAEAKLRSINSDVAVEGIVADVTPRNIAALGSGCDVILDGSDNFELRYLVNDFSVKEGIPWIYAAAVGAYGLTMNILPGETACLRCVFEQAPPPGSAPTCDTAGVLGSVVGVIASLQSAEALKLLSGRREKLSRQIVSVDVWEGSIDRLHTGRRSAECPACGLGRFEHLEGSGVSSTTRLCGRDSVQVMPAGRTSIDLDALAGKLRGLGEVTVNRFLVRARIGDNQLTVFSDGRAIVGGTTDAAAARTLYARYVGA
ncbi:MAG: thiamine biosynthesis protein ThiF [Acidobacteria bacterium]|nr:MAG: thiamine biosynthesis protein ThiF [Acidobacteriota bacterium]